MLRTETVRYLYGIAVIIYPRKNSASGETRQAEEGATSESYEYMLAVKGDPLDPFGHTFTTAEQAQKAYRALPESLYKETRRAVSEWHAYGN